MKIFHSICLVLLVATGVAWAQYSALRFVLSPGKTMVLSSLIMNTDLDTSLNV
jgi:hypothetical protein